MPRLSLVALLVLELGLACGVGCLVPADVGPAVEPSPAELERPEPAVASPELEPRVVEARTPAPVIPEGFERIELPRAGLVGWAPRGSTVSGRTGFDLLFGPDISAAVMVRDDAPQTIEEAKAEAQQYAPKHFASETLDDGYVVTFSNELVYVEDGTRETQYRVWVLRRLGGRDVWCSATAWMPFQQERSLAFASSSRCPEARAQAEPRERVSSPTMGGDAPILVTGITGFIGIHCALAALREGYRVRGGLREKPGVDRRSKVRSILEAELGESLGERLEFAPVDLLADPGWDEAVAGCSGVLHIASPVPSGGIDDPDALVEPARAGALRLLKAAAASESTTRVVLTSSTAAVVHGHARDATSLYGPETFSVPEACPAYPRSKVLAERAAWDFVESLEPGTLELVTILPGMVYGPVPDPSVYSPSGEPVRKLLMREVPLLPDLGWAAVDVRDVAELHVRALEVPEAAGHRFPLGSDHFTLSDVAAVLAPHFRPKGYRVPRWRMPNWMVKIGARFDPQIHLALHDLAKFERVDTSTTKAILGWKPRPVDRALIDMGESLIAKNLLSPPE